MSDKTGDAVVRQAQDDSLLNTQPALTVGFLMAAAGFATSLVFRATGFEPPPDFAPFFDQWGDDLALLALPIITGAIVRLKAFSPKTAAEVAVANYNLGRSPFSEAAGGVEPGPTLDV